MIRVTIDISDAKKWDELKPVLGRMGLDYFTQDADSISMLSEKKLILFQKAKDDVKEDRVFNYTNHREILSK